jgi:16S rRNA G966 N2-methylase RsmD
MTDQLETVLDDEQTCGLGEIVIQHPPGTFALTTASRMAVEAIGRQRELLSGVALDWGSGTGVMAIAAARIPAVERVIGLELDERNIAAARSNASRNSVSSKTRFMHANSYAPFAEEDRQRLDALRGKVQFILSNPPTSKGDDGFEWRREVLRGARQFLAPGGLVLLNVSFQYGPERIDQLTVEIPEFKPAGFLASSDWVAFDLKRPDLMACLVQYAHAEKTGSLRYTFPNPEDMDGPQLTAVEALERFERTGENPYTMWLVLLFKYLPEQAAPAG